MLVNEHIRQLVKACAPRSHEEFVELWSNIKPVKFGNVVDWLLASTYTLADYQVPRDVFNVVLRVEVYTLNTTAGAADYGAYEPPPSGAAYWRYLYPGTLATQTLTDPNSPTQLLLDSDEFLIFQGGYNIQLIGDFAAGPDADTREVRTLVYSYNCGPMIVDRIGSNQVYVPIST